MVPCRRHRSCLAAALAALIGAPAAARAQSEGDLQEFPPITDRNYTLDLYMGSVLGSVSMVGMGSTAVATGVGSAGSLFNPAAVAVRPETSTRLFDWDWHFDWLTSAIGTDYDNNGDPETTDYRLFRGPVITGGILGQYGPWGLGLSLVYMQRPIEQSESVTLLPQFVMLRLDIGKSFFDDELTVGTTILFGHFRFSEVVSDEDLFATRTSLFSLSGIGLQAGVLWRPPARNLRLGASAALPLATKDVDIAECNPLDCGGASPGEGYILPESAELPWQVSFGAAWRRASTAWNRKVLSEWRDEKALLLAADLVINGHVPGGYGLEAFARKQLQPSGRTVGFSPRVGAQYEWVPGWFRIRGGTYFEPSHFRDPDGEDIPGRLHVTLGFDVRLWSFCLWNDRYRLRFSLTTDGASDYANGGFSIGYWN